MSNPSDKLRYKRSNENEQTSQPLLKKDDNSNIFVFKKKNKISCMMCINSTAVCKKYNIKRQYDTIYKESYSRYVKKHFLK